MDEDDEMAASAYRTAYGHARAIVDASKISMITGYWVMARVPVELEAMVEAISKRMNVGTRMGQTPIPLSVIRRAVRDALEGREPRG